jgi:serine/threonine protein kinase
MANVFKARCVGTDYYVAVKILKREYNEDEAFLRKFIAEARSTEGLDHPNIVKNYDAGKDHGLYYIVMELAVEMPTYQRSDLFAYNSSIIDASTLTSGDDLTPYNGPLSRIWEVSLKETNPD